MMMDGEKPLMSLGGKGGEDETGLVGVMMGRGLGGLRPIGRGWISEALSVERVWHMVDECGENVKGHVAARRMNDEPWYIIKCIYYIIANASP